MSNDENLEVRARLTMIDEASPVVHKLISDIRKLESATKSFNSALGGMGRAGESSAAAFNRTADRIKGNMLGMSASAKTASQSIASDFKRANDQMLSDARATYRHLGSLERGYQRQLERREGIERRANRFGGINGVSRMPAPRVRTMAIGTLVAGGGVVSAFKKRMEVEAAETKAAMFGDLTADEIKKLRSDYADRAGIRFGVGSAKAIEVAVEGLKAGVEKQYAGMFGELSLQAQTGLDIDSAATAKLLGRITSLKGAFNKEYLGSVLNAVAVANNETAADGNEIVDALRRSLSATVSTKMSLQDLAAFNASGISIGLQPSKAGTFMGFLTSELANAKNAHGQRAKDLNKAANMLSFNGRSDLSNQMIATPTGTLLNLFKRMMELPEAQRAKAADLIGMREWRDELLAVAAARELIAKTIAEIGKRPHFLADVSLKKIRSLSGRWASISAAFSLIWEKLGAGMESAFESISDAVIDLAANFDFNKVRSQFAALVDGLREGFGLKSWGDAVKSMADQFDAGSASRWKAFGTGFSEGIKDVFGVIKGTFTAVASIFGNGDAKSMGKLVAHIIGLSIALALLAPVINGLLALSGFVTSIALVAGTAGAGAAGVTALFLALAFGFKATLSLVADKIFGAFTAIVDPIVDAIKSIAKKVWNWVKGLFTFGASSQGGATGSWGPSATDFSESRRYGDIVPSAASFSGAARSGLVDRNHIPSFSGGGGSAADNIGSGLSGSAFLAARRERFRRELDADPKLKRRLAAVIDLENPGAGTAVAESLFNRMDMIGGSVAKGIGGGSRSFYGPVRRGLVDPRLRELERNPKRLAERMRQIDEALAGSNLIKGHTDQGSAGDPNYIAGGTGVNINRERFNDWGAGRWRGLRGHAASKAYREEMQRGAESSLTGNVPSQADLIKNIPSSITAPNGSAINQRGLDRGGSQIAININGSSHDPEALATLVQRRIDESMNWRLHDVDNQVG